MSIDLEQFHEAFYAESFDALDSMESALLELDVGAPDPERINTIFRVAHSIKGGAATFGFKEITSFTHSLETLLDELRGGCRQVTTDILDQLLKSVDMLRDMLRATQHKATIDMQRVADLQFDLEVVVARKESELAPTVAGPAQVAAPAPALPERPAQDPNQWQISFRPLPQLLAHGNDPLRLFHELAALGPLSVTVDAAGLPPLAQLDPQVCLLAWTLELTSDVGREVIEQVFDWAEGECTLEVRKLGQASAGIALRPAIATRAANPSGAAAVVAADLSAPPVNQQTRNAAARGKPPAGPARAVEAGDVGSIRVSTEKIDELMNAVGELVISHSMLSQLTMKVEGALAERIRASVAQLERNMRELQESVMRVRMLPISFVFSRFPRMTRDLAQRLDKQVELKVTGENTELDKTVLEKIGDPLVHLLRNCIDHGIEKPAERLAAGKPAMGTVSLAAYHERGQIRVEVADDGRGLATDKIRAKAEARGAVSPTDVLTDEQIYELIFLPGFSTVDEATDVSGRGVGLDVVRRNIKELGGTVELRSQPGKGARFNISLPLTLAVVDGQSVAVGEETYVVPLTAIVESLQLQRTDVNRVAGHGEVFRFRGDYVPVVRLHELFGVKPKSRELHDGLIMVVEGDGKRAGIFVDELLDQQQVVIKSMATNYGSVEGVSGATIMGDGSVALILDIAGLIRGASRRVAA